MSNEENNKAMVIETLKDDFGMKVNIAEGENGKYNAVLIDADCGMMVAAKCGYNSIEEAKVSAKGMLNID